MITALDRIMAVMDAAFEPAWGEAWNRRQVSDSLAFPHTQYNLIGMDGSPPQAGPAAGFTLVRAAPGEEELLLIGVMPGCRGKGLGGRLLQTVLTRARARGAQRVFLEMRYNNPAVSLYSAAGFEAIGRRRDYYRLPDGRTIDAITFARAL
jgi:ribosomal-protein-alanine N-acetyltransferase